MHFVWATRNMNEFHRLVSPLVDTDDIRLQERSPVSTASHVCRSSKKENIIINHGLYFFFCYTTIIKTGETLLYRACDLNVNDAGLVRRLLEKVRRPYTDLGIGSLWCRQDSDSNTILHRAVLKKHDISVIDSILKVDKSVCKVKDRSGRLPGEVILHAKGDNDEYLYGKLPLELVCKLLEKKNPADLELVHE